MPQHRDKYYLKNKASIIKNLLIYISLFLLNFISTKLPIKFQEKLKILIEQQEKPIFFQKNQLRYIYHLLSDKNHILANS